MEYDYGTIAEIVQKKEANCRKILSRIKKFLLISYVVAKLQNKRIDFQYVKINPFMYIKFVYHAKSLMGNVHFHYNCRAHNLFPLTL